MREITAYRCADGSFHTDEDKAKAHEDDLLGQRLGEMLRLFEMSITQTQSFRGILCAIEKREELHRVAQTIINILEN